MERRDKCCIGCGAVALVLAAASVVMVVMWPTVFNTVFQNQILANIIVDGPKSENYDKWNTTNFKDAPTIYESLSMFNMTNADDVAQKGAKPILEEIGPFVYKYNKVKIDVEFLENGAKIKYTDWLYYNFVPELSIGDPKDYIIRSVNPPYLGILAQTHSEYAMTLAYSAVQFRRFMEFMNSTFTHDLALFYASDWLGAVKSQLIKQYRQETNSTLEKAEEYFLSQWANATAADPTYPLWDLVKVSLNSAPSKIGAISAGKIFDPDFPNSIGVPSSRLALNLSSSPFKSWLVRDTNFVNWFGVNLSQLDAISKWIQRSDVAAAIQAHLVSSVLLPRNISSLDDIPCAQWGMGTAWPETFSYSYPTEFPVAPEFFFFAKNWHQTNPGFFSLEQCQRLFYGPGNISDAKQFGDFLKDLGNALKTNNFTDPSRRWLINANSTFELFAYIIYVSTEYSSPMLAKRMAEGSNLMVSRPVHDWIWDYSDKLLYEFMPTAPPPSFKHNMSSPEFARKHYLPCTVWSGSSNYSQVLDFIEYRGYSWIDWLYPGFNMTVRGKTEDGQFQPFLKMGDRIAVFQEEYLRFFPMQAHREIDIQGITALEFEPEKQIWEPHEHFWQEIVGFVNMSAQFNGTPAFLCNPHFYGVQQKWINKIDGVTPNKTRDWTRVGVEPNTGHVVQLWKGVQANMYIPEDAPWFDAYHPNMARGLFIPLLVGYQHVNPTPAIVSLVNDKVYVGLKIGVAGFWVFTALAILLGLFGVLAIALTIRRVKNSTFYFDRNAYERINAES